MLKTGLSHGGRRMAALAGATVVAAAFGGVALSAPAVAATPRVTATDLDSSLVSFTSSTGHRLVVEVHAFVQQGAPANDEADITLTQENGGGTNGTEDHSWMFPIRSTDLDTTTAGQGTLSLSSAELGRFGSLHLTINPMGKAKTQTCSGSLAALVTPVSLSGKFLFKTLSGGAHSWGAVGSNKRNLDVLFTGKSTLTQILAGGGSCLANESTDAQLPCLNALMWDSSDATVDISGYEFPGIDMVTGSRVVSLHGDVPRGSMREDDVVTPVATPKLANVLDPITTLLDGISLIASAHRPAASGTASISSDTAAVRQTVPCGTAGKSESAAAWGGSAYTNGTTPLSLQPQIYGALHVPDNDNAMLLEFGTAATTPIPTSVPTTTASPSTAHLAHADDARHVTAVLEHEVRVQRWHHTV
jgi:hypothetical protein